MTSAKASRSRLPEDMLRSTSFMVLRETDILAVSGKYVETEPVGSNGLGAGHTSETGGA
jgi:hypothetical protein